MQFQWSTVNSCLNNIILGILQTTEYTWEKGDNSYQQLDSSDTCTKSAKVKMRVSQSEAWAAEMSTDLRGRVHEVEL